MSTKDLKRCIEEDIRIMKIVLEGMQFTNTFPQTQSILIRRIKEAEETLK